MLKGKATNLNIGEKYINLNTHISYIDLNINRVALYIHETEKQKRNTFLKTSNQKKLNIQTLKKELNLKKLVYIEKLRTNLNTIKNEIKNPFAEYERFKKEGLKVFVVDTTTQELLNKYIDFKNIGIIYQTLFISSNFHIITFLKNIDQDIKKLETILKDFETFYKSISNENLKVSELDLKLLKEGIYSKNLKEVFYFYFAYLNKKSKSKHFKTNDLNLKLKTGLATETEILKVIDNNLKHNLQQKIKVLQSFEINQTLKNNILNRYI